MVEGGEGEGRGMIKCFVWLPNRGAWGELPESHGWREGFAAQLHILEFMMHCDVGWTGMIFAAREVKVALCTSWDHVVDVRG